MEGKLSKVSRTLTPSPIQELSHLAQRCGAINLAEGFPDFPAPDHIKHAAVSAINSDLNQYRHVQGICELLAARAKSSHGLETDAATDFVICCGQSEAFAATMFAIIDEGDEVLLFDPAYEAYEACISLAGGIPVSPARSSAPKAKILQVLNRNKNEISGVCAAGSASLEFECRQIDEIFCKSNESSGSEQVYEHITFDRRKHMSLASLPGMQERSIITSSLSKTFSVTGWRIGWACAPANIASAIRNIHIKITDSAPAPFQEAALTALRSPPAYFDNLKTDYETKRDYIVETLSSLGFQIRFQPQGSVFVFAELPKTWQLSDVDFIREMIKKAGVAAVPGCGFFHTCNGEKYHNSYVRFAFCKSHSTLSAAAQKLRETMNETGFLRLN